MMIDDIVMTSKKTLDRVLSVMNTEGRYKSLLTHSVINQFTDLYQTNLYRDKLQCQS
jgi:hypothetical protein